VVEVGEVLLTERLVRGLHFVIVVQPQRADLRGIEQSARSLLILRRDEDLDTAQAVEREAMSLAQRLTTHDGLDAFRLEETSHLLRVQLTVCDKHTTLLPVHLAVGYLASGEGRNWKCRTLLGVPLPPSMWNGARVLTVAHRPFPFQPARASSMRPSIHFV
jgi:hypothetical protein